MHQLHARSFSGTFWNGTCPEVNTVAVSDEKLFSGAWTPHKIGWAVCFGMFLLCALITSINIWRHCRNYRKPLEQRQIVRLLLTPFIFALGSTLSYIFFRKQEYFEVIRDGYEGLCIAAFLVLILLYLAETPAEQREKLAEKEKRSIPGTFGLFRFRPSKPKFLVNVKWSVLQYALLKPLLSIIGVVCEALGKLCSVSWSFRFASVWLFAADFISLTIALWGLWTLYVLISPDFKGRNLKLLPKFLSVKIIIALIFYQGLVFSALQSYGFIHETEFWTEENISQGLNSLATTFEMVLIAAFQMWAFPVSEYQTFESTLPPTSFWRSLGHSLNFSDFLVDIWLSLRFYFDYMVLRKEYTRLKKDHDDSARLLGGNNLDLGQAYDVSVSTLPYSTDRQGEKNDRPAYVIHVHQDSEEDLDEQLKEDHDSDYPPNSSRWSDNSGDESDPSRRRGGKL